MFLPHELLRLMTQRRAPATSARRAKRARRRSAAIFLITHYLSGTGNRYRPIAVGNNDAVHVHPPPLSTKITTSVTLTGGTALSFSGRGDFVGGIDNEALDFSQLEDFINSDSEQPAT